MTTPTTGATPAKRHPPFRLPDIPEKDPDDMTSSKHLARNGNMYRLAHHVGNPENIIVSGDRYICSEPGTAIRYPDLLVAFGADPELYEANNGYVVSLQGKPPDLVLEIASRATGHIDTGVKCPTSTPAWELPSIGALTKQESFTEKSWVETGWWMELTNRYLWKRWLRAASGATAVYWTCTCPGSKGAWSFTIPRPAPA